MKIPPKPLAEQARRIADALATTDAESVQRVLAKTPGHAELPANTPNLAKVLSGGIFEQEVNRRFLGRTEAALTNAVRNGESAIELQGPAFQVGDQLSGFWNALTEVRPDLEHFRHADAPSAPNAVPNRSEKAMTALADAVERILTASNATPLSAEYFANGFASLAAARPLLGLAGPAVKSKTAPLNDELIETLIANLSRELAQRAVSPLQQQTAIQNAQKGI